ncbi:checkpoint kinase [Nannochloropsis gaditana]|uniref:Checkpoint kinase n=1 Tax=Nannochloropsis gaditana TaxID=72520 RepID=W7TPX7_9STRA|nr:checkpoint kinase [Nannochloropsis gaditana]
MLLSPQSDAPCARAGGASGRDDNESFSSRGPTQVEDDFLDSYEERTLMSGDTQQEPGFTNGDATRDAVLEPWGRLLPLKRGAAHIKLLFRPAETSHCQANTYILGRGRSCDIRLDDVRISSQHCRVYCLESREPGGRITFKVYVEDMSSNGTFVNRRVRLAKGQRRLLNSGDELCLVKAREDQDYEAASYVFIPMEPKDRQQRQPRQAGGMPSPSFESSLPTTSIPPPTPAIASCVFSSASSPRAAQTVCNQNPCSRPLVPHDGKHSFAGKYVRRIEEFYDIREEIGRGTCGRVHVALHRKTGESWAIKIIETRKFGLTPGLSPKELVQEAEVLRSIAHPYVVRLQDIFQTEDVIYLVMELVQGGDLFDRIVDRGRYPEATARKLIRNVLQAVQYLHARNIVHRDLKPENILLVHRDSDVDVKLTDFGLAKRTTSEGLKTFCGTPQYFAPEVLKRRNTTQGTGRYGREADMWSLGVILYIVLSGTPPFDDSTLFEQIRTATYTFEGPEWESVSTQAKDLVSRLMTASPATRLEVDQALSHPWFATSLPPFDVSKTDDQRSALAEGSRNNGSPSSMTDGEDEIVVAAREEHCKNIVTVTETSHCPKGESSITTSVMVLSKNRKSKKDQEKMDSSLYEANCLKQAQKEMTGPPGVPPLTLQNAAALRQATTKQNQQYKQRQGLGANLQILDSPLPSAFEASREKGRDKRLDIVGRDCGKGPVKRRKPGRKTFEVGVTTVELPDDKIAEYSSAEEGETEEKLMISQAVESSSLQGFGEAFELDDGPTSQSGITGAMVQREFVGVARIAESAVSEAAAGIEYLRDRFASTRRNSKQSTAGISPSPAGPIALANVEEKRLVRGQGMLSVAIIQRKSTSSKEKEKRVAYDGLQQEKTYLTSKNVKDPAAPPKASKAAIHDTHSALALPVSPWNADTASSVAHSSTSSPRQPVEATSKPRGQNVIRERKTKQTMLTQFLYKGGGEKMAERKLRE